MTNVMTEKGSKRNCNLQLVHTPRKGLLGLLEDAKRAFPDRELPLQLSFYTPYIEIYAGVTWARCIGDDCEHSKIFRPESIGLIVEDKPELVNKLYERSINSFKHLFYENNNHKSKQRWEGTERNRRVLQQEFTFSGPCLDVNKSLDNKKFELHLANRWGYGRSMPKEQLADFDGLVASCIGRIKFGTVRGQYPSVEDVRYYTIHPAMICGP